MRKEEKHSKNFHCRQKRNNKFDEKRYNKIRTSDLSKFLILLRN